jgi:hypothetical protein
VVPNDGRTPIDHTSWSERVDPSPPFVRLTGRWPRVIWFSSGSNPDACLASRPIYLERVDRARLSILLEHPSGCSELTTSSARAFPPSGRRRVGYQSRARGQPHTDTHGTTSSEGIPVTLDHRRARCWISRSTTRLA